MIDNMNDFKQQLDKFDLVLRKYNRPNYDKMQAPLEKSELDFYLNRLGLNDNNIRTLFEWKNGFDMSKGIGTRDAFTFAGILFSLKDILEFVEYDPSEYALLPPLFGDDTGDLLLFSNRNGQDYGKIYLYSVSLFSIDTKYIIYDSLYTLIETTLEAYETKALIYDKSTDYLDIDIDKYYEIGK
jgi:hypothetical protein